jgi:hypothetical protein
MVGRDVIPLRTHPVLFLTVSVVNSKGEKIMKADQSALKSSQSSFGPLQIGILLLGLVDIIIHLVVLNLQIFSAEGRIDVLFTLNGLAFLVLLIAYFLPVPIAQNNRNLVRWLLIGLSALTILAWVAIGERNLLGYVSKLAELGLIVLLWLDRRQS